MVVFYLCTHVTIHCTLSQPRGGRGEKEQGFGFGFFGVGGEGVWKRGGRLLLPLFLPSQSLPFSFLPLLLFSSPFPPPLYGEEERRRKIKGEEQAQKLCLGLMQDRLSSIVTQPALLFPTLTWFEKRQYPEEERGEGKGGRKEKRTKIDMVKWFLLQCNYHHFVFIPHSLPCNMIGWREGKQGEGKGGVHRIHILDLLKVNISLHISRFN